MPLGPNHFQALNALQMSSASSIEESDKLICFAPPQKNIS